MEGGCTNYVGTVESPYIYVTMSLASRKGEAK